MSDLVILLRVANSNAETTRGVEEALAYHVREQFKEKNKPSMPIHPEQLEQAVEAVYLLRSLRNKATG